MIGIYKIENNINHKKYIGQSIDIEKRWSVHIAFSKSNNIKYKNKLHLAMEKEGIENFSFSILEECSQEELDEKEKYWINFYNSIQEGYNNTDGGISGFRNLINEKKIYQYDLNGHFIQEFCSIKAAAKALGLSGANLTTCCQGKQKTVGGFQWCYEKKDFLKPMINERDQNHYWSSNKKDINQFSKNGDFIASFSSAHEAARANNIKGSSHITECCNGKRKTCGGYIWRYKEDC